MRHCRRRFQDDSVSLTLVQLRRSNQAVLVVQATPKTAQLSANLLYAVRLVVSGTRFRPVLRRRQTRPLAAEPHDCWLACRSVLVKLDLKRRPADAASKASQTG